jgi:hypothetical protein
MVVDRGLSRLINQSIHHPRAGIGATNPQPVDTTAKEQEAVLLLVEICISLNPRRKPG